MGTVAIEEVTGRIAENLECLKRFTATPGDGCTRLPFTKEARDAVNYLREVMTEAGLEVHEDEAGNVIGILKGENPDLPCVMMGSHYDSVVNGGDFDGIAGVVCAIEAARQLKDEGLHQRETLQSLVSAMKRVCVSEQDILDPELCLDTEMLNIANITKIQMEFLSMMP